MNEKILYSHNYSIRDDELVEYSFHELDALPGFALRGPAVDVANRDDYFTCLGAAQTLGVYVPTPFPELLTQQLGVTAWNLGVGGASPSFFLQHPEVFEFVNKGRFVVLQVMTARDEPNDRFEATPVSSLVRDRKHGDMGTAGGVWQRIMEEEPENAEQYVAQSRANWEKHIAQLVEKITVPIVHFWFSPKPLSAPLHLDSRNDMGIIDTFPQFVNGENLGFITDENPLVTCFSDRDEQFLLRSRYTGKVVEINHAILDRTGMMPATKETLNVYYPSPQMHWDAAIVLGQEIKKRGLV